MLLADFSILAFATILSGWRDANVKINPLARSDHGPGVQGDERAAKAIALGTATAISLSYVAASIA